MKKLALWLVTILLVSLLLGVAESPAVAQDGFYPDQYFAEINGTDVRLRAGAGLSYAILGVADNGDRFLVIGGENGWAKIQATREVECWVASQFVEPGTGVVTGDSVNLRVGPEAAGIPMGQVDSNDRVTIIDRRDGWFRIVPPVGAGVWVYDQYVTRVGSVWEHAAEIQSIYGPGYGPEVQPEPTIAEPAEPTIPTPTPAEIRQRELDLLNALTEQFEAVSARGDDVTERQFTGLAAEFEALAEACENREIATEAMTRAEALRSAWSEIAHAREVARQQALAEQRRLAREAAQRRRERQALAEAERERQEVVDRLFHTPAEGHVATGTITDGRDGEGNHVYLLVQGGRILFVLRVARGVEIDLRTFWHQQVGVTGTVVTYTGREHPVLVCDAVDALVPADPE